MNRHKTIFAKVVNKVEEKATEINKATDEQLDKLAATLCKDLDIIDGGAEYAILEVYDN